jgi:AraC-like DNA-binding protein
VITAPVSFASGLGLALRSPRHPPGKEMSMDHEAITTSWVALLETRDRLIAELRHDVPAAWRAAISRFLNEIKAVEEPLPSGVVLLLLTDLARELDRLAPGGPSNPRRDRLVAALEACVAAPVPADVLCHQFEAALHHWCGRIEPGSLVPEVQAQRVATYIDQHFAEHITLTRLARMSGWCTRQLSRAFRTTMHMSIRQYLQKTRIDHAAARLREGDKVESVVAAVGWRGRKNFFHQFKHRVGTTPARYRECWMGTPAVELPGRQGSELTPIKPRVADHRARRTRTVDSVVLSS